MLLVEFNQASTFEFKTGNYAKRTVATKFMPTRCSPDLNVTKWARSRGQGTENLGLKKGYFCFHRSPLSCATLRTPRRALAVQPYPRFEV